MAKSNLQQDSAVVRPVLRKKIAELTYDPENARKHSDSDVGAIASSLAKFGQQSPIVISSDGVVVKGNGTMMAAQKLGWEEIDVIETSLTGQELRAYAIADNKTALLSSWDGDRLAKQLSELEESLKESTGFSELELKRLCEQIGTQLDEVEFDDDEFVDLEDSVDSMRDGVRRAIQIEFTEADYDIAYDLVSKARSRGENVGLILIDALTLGVRREGEENQGGR